MTSTYELPDYLEPIIPDHCEKRIQRHLLSTLWAIPVFAGGVVLNAISKSPHAADAHFGNMLMNGSVYICCGEWGIAVGTAMIHIVLHAQEPTSTPRFNMDVPDYEYPDNQLSQGTRPLPAQVHPELYDWEKEGL